MAGLGHAGQTCPSESLPRPRSRAVFCLKGKEEESNRGRLLCIQKMVRGVVRAEKLVLTLTFSLIVQ